MCGICGTIVYRDRIPDPEALRTMCRTLAHRGPDDEGIHTAPHIGLGQRRLSVIDLSPGACPPLSNEDRTVWLVFNGEIYNYRELRRDLIAKGHRFATNSDTETLIHLYEEQGPDCLRRLRGMFAFALWDAVRGRLFCARDRLGKKPFCYAATPEGLVFGSEIKAVTAAPGISSAPDYHALDLYLTYGFVPSPLTAFDGISRLGPGEFLTCDVEGRVNRERYWEPPADAAFDASPKEIAAGLAAKLREAVRLRLEADVPLGVFLSGGVDSSTVAALAAQESPGPVRTFSIGFEDEDFNELPYARELAARIGAEHHEMIVEPSASELLPLLVRHYNEPFADSSAIPTFYVSRMTRPHVTVALSGDGGDESFAGYDNYSAILSWRDWDRWPLWSRRVLAGPGRAALAALPRSNGAARLRRGLAMAAARNVRERRLQYGTVLKPEEKRLAYARRFKSLLASGPRPADPLAAYPWRAGDDDLGWLMRHDLRFYLPDELMVKTDIASMAHGLEVRSPFLDHELVEYAARIPSSFKHDGDMGKIILRSAVSDLLPPSILNKPKTGFAVPLGRWLRGKDAPLLGMLLDGRTARRGLLRPSLLRKMIGEHLAGRRDWSGRLWAFLFLESWFREYID